MRRTFARPPDKALLVPLAVFFTACFPSVVRRAGVGGDVKPTQGAREERGQKGTLPSVEKSPTANANTIATKNDATAGKAASPVPAPAVGTLSSAEHPFVGKAFDAFDFGATAEVKQTGLKLSRAYYRVLRMTGTERYFIYPGVRYDQRFLSLCLDESDPLHASFQATWCKVGTSDAVTYDEDLMLRLAKVVNDAFRFSQGPFYETDAPAVKKWRVTPTPHGFELAEVCVEQKSGPLGTYCTAFLANRADAEAAARKGVVFPTEAEAKAMLASLHSLYGIK